jgi:glycosyltransferase involved in cell wall biosynthesis
MVDYTGKNVCTKINYEKCCRCIGVFDQIELLERIVRRINRIYSGRQLIKLPRLKSNNVIYRNEFMIKFLESARVVLPVSNRVRNIFIEACPRANYQVEHIGNETANHISSTKTDSRKIRVGFIGVLNYMKGAEVLRSFLFNVKRTDMEFHFYGRADSLYQLTLTELGLNFHGSYNPSDLADIMSKIDIGLVLPVWEDNGPQVVMEFLNSGTPVLGTKRGGIIDFINTDNGMLFEPNTPEGINDAVQWLQTITHEKIRSLIKSIVPTITPEEHMQRMYEIYNNALRNTSIT